MQNCTVVELRDYLNKMIDQDRVDSNSVIQLNDDVRHWGEEIVNYYEIDDYEVVDKKLHIILQTVLQP
jgi:hypothetical protein